MIIWETAMGDIKGDTRSLDYGSFGSMVLGQLRPVSFVKAWRRLGFKHLPRKP